MKMLDNSVTDDGTRRRSTFYVPLTESGHDNNEENSKNLSIKKFEKNNLVSFSPFRRTPKKSLSPTIQKVVQEANSPNSPINSFLCESPDSKLNSKIVEPSAIRPKVEKNPVRIIRLQQPQKPKTLDASKLLKTSSVSVPSLDHSFSLPQLEVKSASSTQSLETVGIQKPTTKNSNLFVKKTNNVKVNRSSSQRLPDENLAKKVTVTKIDISSSPPICALQTPPRGSNKNLNVPLVVVESEDTDDSTSFKKSGENYNIQVNEDDDAGIHSGR